MIHLLLLVVMSQSWFTFSEPGELSSHLCRWPHSGSLDVSYTYDIIHPRPLSSCMLLNGAVLCTLKQNIFFLPEGQISPFTIYIDFSSTAVQCSVTWWEGQEGQTEWHQGRREWKREHDKWKRSAGVCDITGVCSNLTWKIPSLFLQSVESRTSIMLADNLHANSRSLC